MPTAAAAPVNEPMNASSAKWCVEHGTLSDAVRSDPRTEKQSPTAGTNAAAVDGVGDWLGVPAAATPLLGDEHAINERTQPATAAANHARTRHAPRRESSTV